MAGGPFKPSSVFPVTATLSAGFHVAAGANVKRFEGLQFPASLAADATWELIFEMPTTLPTGTPTFRLLCVANATSGVIRLNPKWVSVAVGESYSAATPVAESVTPTSQAGQAGGSGATLTFGTGDADQVLEARWTMDADTVVAGELVVMALVAESASWTLAQVLTVQPSILFV